ncbi:intradiol ring-cleavage dioxygenase [Deinococcus planocerae]|uniref:intradiol ring-cleavage dioxygenase n=1 Tax=Deinococcus planocerae TaxID=1737569 RepID=UPI000C7EF5A0|nr:intradiol ring-cleavage dioxygenase [Deinococcus planocerae]
MNPHPQHDDQDNDDEMVGTLLSRRAALRLLGLGGAGLAVGGGVLAQRSGTSAGTGSAASLPGCVVRPAMTEGPFFVQGEPRRSDLRRDTSSGQVSAGVPLTLTFVTSRVAVGACEPRANVLVDVWQCDALGVYSGVQGDGGNFLRGSQVTDARGRATFTTVYPGWYPGRAVHIHFKLRPLNASGQATGEFTSQLFFPEEVTDRVHARTPYSRKGRRNVLNAGDGIYRNGGNQLLLNPTGSPEQGYRATFDVGLNLG